VRLVTMASTASLVFVLLVIRILSVKHKSTNVLPILAAMARLVLTV
jgi:hypothetical protein